MWLHKCAPSVVMTDLTIAQNDQLLKLLTCSELHLIVKRYESGEGYKGFFNSLDIS